jgi:hypothetical protein
MLRHKSTTIISELKNEKNQKLVAIIIPSLSFAYISDKMNCLHPLDTIRNGTP